MTHTIRRNPIIRAIAVLALALGVFAVAPSVSGAAGPSACLPGTYGNGQAGIAGNPTQVSPGGTTTITGHNFGPTCVLSLTIGASCAAGTSIGNVTTDANGNFSTTWTVPTNQASGTLTVCTSVGGAPITTTIMVSAATAPTTTLVGNGNGNGSAGANGNGTGVLPATGSQVLPFVAGGVLLLVVGSMLVLAARKRNATN
ncbi:MAG: LPXTG cell wall anchor domain-containing protein [Actinobacteria bacterium]|nr:LPXTG cell wall anchor domain-containing protein [Actinomycetota bacterium]